MAICFGFYVYKRFNQDAPLGNSNSNFKLIAHFEEGVVSDTTLYSTIDAIQNKNIRKLLRTYGVVKLKAAFTNRYDTAGFLKPNTKSLLPGVWQQVILSDNHKAEDLIARLKNEKGVTNAYIECPIPLVPVPPPLILYIRLNGT